ncbi:MAG: fused DSP-PTPase phosphatase/NAD kinase-like protein [Pyrinomonadaceae bacterium]
MVFTFALAFLFTLSFCAAAIAQTSPRKDFPGIKISNFGKMDDRFYRGARPKKDKGQFEALKTLGIQTVIDLTDNPKPYGKIEAEAAGLRYINIPMKDDDYPEAATIELLTKTINDPEIGVFYVHCAGGRHRTGITGAIWRFTKYGWEYDRVYREMKNYDFYTRWGHGEMKTFVQDYAAKTAAQRSTPTAETSTAPELR